MMKDVLAEGLNEIDGGGLEGHRWIRRMFA